ncbi:MAG: phosphate ABC transporter permease subunit PstC [Chloroflexaceae bacterium]|nr:phosphate ABC transporter permease subunit PstC [Chloroflexaceae bacterium]
METKAVRNRILQQVYRRIHYGDTVFWLITLVFALVVVGMIGAILFVTLYGSAMAREQFGWGFLTNPRWYHEQDGVPIYGAWPAVYGTLASSTIAVLLAGPIGIGSGVFLAELCPPWLRMPLSVLIELLAAIPSVIFGLWGVLVLAPLFERHIAIPVSRTIGTTVPLLEGPVSKGGVMIAGMVLALMILPTIAAITRDVVAVVPNSQRELLFSLGATRWQVIWLAVLPYAFAGVIGGVMLGLGRALGETMAAVMLIGNRTTVSLSLFASGTTSAALIATQLPNREDALHESALIYLALILFAITFTVNALARLLVWRIAASTR